MKINNQTLDCRAVIDWAHRVLSSYTSMWYVVNSAITRQSISVEKSRRRHEKGKWKTISGLRSPSWNSAGNGSLELDYPSTADFRRRIILAMRKTQKEIFLQLAVTILEFDRKRLIRSRRLPNNLFPSLRHVTDATNAIEKLLPVGGHHFGIRFGNQSP
jgi:hypothetical protein